MENGDKGVSCDPKNIRFTTEIAEESKRRSRLKRTAYDSHGGRRTSALSIESKEVYDKVRNWENAMKKQAKVTSKGQVTVPREIRRRLGVSAGDRLLFEDHGNGVRVTAVRKKSPFAKYQGIGTPGIGKGRKGIQKWLRELRGE